MHPLKALRQSRGLSQSDVARAAGCSQSSVGRIEAGGRIAYGGALPKIADALGVGVSEIVTRDQCHLAPLLDRTALVASWLGLDPEAPGTVAYLEHLHNELAVR